MKHLRIAGLCLVATFLMGMAVSAAASAEGWERCSETGSGTKYSEHQCLKAASEGAWSWQELGGTEKVKGTGLTITLTDRNTPTGVTTAICTAGGEEEGSVGPGDLGRIEVAKVKEAAKNCRGTGGCKTEGIEKVEGVHLPWQTRLYETEGKDLNQIENDGKGEPGWKVVCETILGKKEETDECVTEENAVLEDTFLENKLSGTELLVLATLANVEKAKCSIGGAESGEEEGSIKLKSGGGEAMRQEGDGSLKLLNPAALDFGKVKEKTSSTVIFKYESPVNEIQFLGHFIRGTGFTLESGSTCIGKLKAKVECRMEVRFTPPADKKYQGRLTMEYENLANSKPETTASTFVGEGVK